ncbi:MAG TPA: hypothetical protein VK983_01600 [Candidatus Limnocylindrales bacterium]|nr:hypothetical protein [Candidatus Limnocylindrales bacterium]
MTKNRKQLEMKFDVETRIVGARRRAPHQRGGRPVLLDIQDRNRANHI